MWQTAIAQFRFRSLKQWIALFLVGFSLSFGLASCTPGGSEQNVEITLSSFAVTRGAYKTIIPKFVEKWRREHHQNVTIAQSYGGSGAQARAVIDGLDADVVHLAMTLDISKIETAGLIMPGWEKEVPNHGIVSKSVAALVIREGNPKNITTWVDLAKEGISLVTADPKTSGVARWNFLALWNSVIKTGGDEAAAEAFVTKVYKNAPVLPRDAREATDAFFKQEQGDVLINYENEILLAESRGNKLPFTIPAVNISIDHAIAVVDKNVDHHSTRAVAEAFVNYLFTPEAQAEFVKAGFRPIDETKAQTPEIAKKYPAVQTLGKVADYSGWNSIQTKFFADNALFDQIQKQLRQ